MSKAAIILGATAILIGVIGISPLSELLPITLDFSPGYQRVVESERSHFPAAIGLVFLGVGLFVGGLVSCCRKRHDRS